MINKFINNLDDAPFHSSGYAEAANSGNIGAVSPQVFSQRLHVEKNRQSVRRYRDSLIAHGHRRDAHHYRIDIVKPPTRPDAMPPTDQSAAGAQASLRSVSPAPVRPQVRQNFIEPPARGFNPYK